MSRLRLRCSSRYLRIPPLHREFHSPLPVPRHAVSKGVAGLSPALSPPTCAPTCARFTPSNSEQRSHPLYYRGCWHRVSRCFLWGYRQNRGIASPARSSPLTAVYTPKSFLPHAASLRQAFAHCARFPTAASRRSLGRISVPMWPIILSDRLRVVGLVGRYPANYLIRREPLSRRSLAGAFLPSPIEPGSECGISPGFPGLSPTERQVAHVLRTRSPLTCSRRSRPVRLACVKRAASVRPEPGSNSPLENSISSMERTTVVVHSEFVLTMSRFSALEDTMPRFRPVSRRATGRPGSSTPTDPCCQTSAGR